MQKNSGAYTALSSLYEEITICDYEKWSQYLYELSQKYLSEKKTGIDAGCGTGYFTRFFKKLGYEISGFDISRHMLMVAAQNSAAQNLKIEYTLQDAKNFKSINKVDFITAINDLVNYLPPKDVPKFFKSAHSALKKDGVLVFDISTEYKLKNILSNNVFAEDNDNFSYIWFNKMCENYVIMALTIFTRERDFYKKSEERHIQYAHSADFIKDSLKLCGFEIFLEEDFLNQTPPTNTTERIFFCARKT